MKKRGTQITALGLAVVAIILVIGTIWMGRSAAESTEEAVRSVSLFYLDELAGRREQVVESNFEDSISDIKVTVGLMDDEDLSDIDHFRAFQARMKKIYDLEKFAFIDEDGLIYTSKGYQDNLAEYDFNYKKITEPDISIKDINSDDKKVVIAVPIDNVEFEGKDLVVAFMEQDMDVMLKGVSLQADDNETTFCNLYTKDGIALSNKVLAGMASENNLLSAMKHAEFDAGYSYDAFAESFKSGEEGVASFTYGNVNETLYYVPVDGTDLILTYLIRQSLISEKIRPISQGVIVRSLIQTILTALILCLMFVVVVRQTRRSAQLEIEKETSEAENRIKQQELEQRLTLQEKLLEQEKVRAEQDDMITALASDYRSVYYVDLNADESICYRSDPMMSKAYEMGEHFSYTEGFGKYGDEYVTDAYKEDYRNFVDPDHLRRALEKEPSVTMRYLVQRNGKEYYEMLRMANVSIEGQQEDGVNIISAAFADVDTATRDELAKSQALSDALAAAEEANKAKTAFLSNMSHEIRTPMNAIIGLDNIAMNDPETTDKVRGYLQKIDNSAKHLLGLINDILDMSRIESGKMVIRNEEFSLPKLLEQINTLVSGQCSDRNLEYNCQIEGDIDDYYIGDDMKLRQVLLNILSNAIKFTPEGGRVDFTVKRVATFDNKSTLRFSVADTGIGMDQGFLKKIFEPFTQEDSSATNKYGSSGLGMAITKNIVDMMSGDIEVKSEKGKGSEFTVTVTLLDSEREMMDSDNESVDPKELSVLIIDDDPVACEHARLVLEKAGIASETALSGQEALEMVRLRHARRESYNLILVDWKMPEMDGIETTRKIREIVGDESAIIILTAYRWEEIFDEATEAGVDSFVSKPLFASNLMDEFQQALQKKKLLYRGKQSKTDLKGKHILLAEDVAVNAEIIMMLLNMREMVVDLADNGRIALEKFAESEENHYDAILMDMRMPEMDGLTATAKIRALDRADAQTIPIIALTANAFDEDVQRSLQAGLNAHLTKPVEPDNLFETLENFIC
ncbi:MAG: response regulator [Bacillota bacterium]|nr:response regulator [Bacillota bacterium]